MPIDEPPCWPLAASRNSGIGQHQFAAYFAPLTHFHQDDLQFNSAVRIIRILAVRSAGRSGWSIGLKTMTTVTRNPAHDIRRRPLLAAVILLARLVLLAAPGMWLPGTANAQFAVCNQTLDVVNVAIGEEVDRATQTDGWWTLGANQCVNVIREELRNRYVYIYATDVFGNPILEGAVEMCIGRHRFTIRGMDDCWLRGHIAAPFLEVDTLEQASWTLFFTGRAP